MSTATRERLTRSPEEIGHLLGVSRQTVYLMIEAGTIPAIRVGHLWRIPWRAFLSKYGEALGLADETDPAA